MPDNGFSKVDPYSCLPSKRSALSPPDPDQSLLSFFWWHRVVEEYSRLRLTYPRDKLPDLAGIATPMSHQTGYCYTYALWSETIAIDLLSGQTHKMGRKQPPNVFAAMWRLGWRGHSGGTRAGGRKLLYRLGVIKTAYEVATSYW
jgi:hypothetical protein